MIKHLVTDHTSLVTPSWISYFHLKTVFGSDAILVIGGHTGDTGSDVTIVPLDGVGCTKPSQIPQDMLGAVGYLDEEARKAFVCGGWNMDVDPIRHCYEYSLETDRWSYVPYRAIEATRSNSATVMLANGSLIALGGGDTSNNILNTSEFPFEGRPGPRLPLRVEDHCACLANGTHLLMAGGFYNKETAYLLEVETAQWTRQMLPVLSVDRPASQMFFQAPGYD